jgi:hypothetical protein
VRLDILTIRGKAKLAEEQAAREKVRTKFVQSQEDEEPSHPDNKLTIQRVNWIHGPGAGNLGPAEKISRSASEESGRKTLKVVSASEPEYYRLPDGRSDQCYDACRVVPIRAIHLLIEVGLRMVPGILGQLDDGAFMKLKDRIAVVTGAAAGLGRAAAVRLASEGASVEILDIADASEARSEICRSGGRAQSILCDCTDEAQIAAPRQKSKRATVTSIFS